MTNNLRQISKDLKAFAKRTKDFKYTNSGLVIFLMTGMVSITSNLFSASTNKSIENQKQGISSSIKSIQQKVKETRRENDKLLKNTNLELIQLMEQGDHVVKSPWSSWQYGMNYFYNDWHGTFKGRGNKLDNTIYQRDTTMAKYKYNRDPQLLYGNTTKLGIPIEPNAAIPVSASLTPLIPKIKQANLALGIDISNLPAFEPRTVTAPKAPTITPVNGINPPSFTLTAQSLGNGGETYYDDPDYYGGHGVIDSVSINSGNFVVARTKDLVAGFGIFGLWRYSHAGYNVTNAFNNHNMYSTGTSDPIGLGGSKTVPSRIGTTTKGKTGFLRMVNDPAGTGQTEASTGTTMLNKGNFMYTREMPTSDTKFVRELAHLDTHRAKAFTDEKTKLLTVAGSTSPEIKAYDDVKDIALHTTNSTKSQTFINSGTVIIEGKYSAFTNSYDHSDPTNGLASVINTSTGNIVIHPLRNTNGNQDSHSAVFIVSPEISGKGTPQIFYNAGNIKVYNNNSAVFFLNPDGMSDGQV